MFKISKTNAIFSLRWSGAVLLVLSVIFIAKDNLAMIDLLQYWAGAKLFLSGGDPYSIQEMTVAQGSIGISKEAILFWNTPILLPFLLPISVLSFTQLKALWIFITLTSYLLSIKIIIDYFNLKRRNYVYYAALAISILSYPFAMTLEFGQISALILFSFAGFLYFKDKDPYKAGALLSFTLIKPHLLFLFYLLLLKSNMKAFLGLVFGGALLTTLAIIWDPYILLKYIEAFKHAPTYWQTPTLGSWLYYLYHEQGTLIRFIPSILIVSFYLFLPLKFTDSTIFKIIPLSLFLSPYGWVFDQVLLLPSILYLFSFSVRKSTENNFKPLGLFIAFYIQVFIFFILTPKNMGQQLFVWVPISILAGIILVEKIGRSVEVK